MSACPTCGGELHRDAIGGHGHNSSKAVLLCNRCWTVWPPTTPPRHLEPVTDRHRKDLA